MPKIYLSPSTQEFNRFVTGESEEYFMNLLADFLVPYLYSNGISYKRNKIDMTAKENIEDSNKGFYDFHLALHSNASPEGYEGERSGMEIFYFPESVKGLKMANIIKNNMESIYEGEIRLIPTTSLGEVDMTKAPAVLFETAYHDNIDDAMWIEKNLPLIAEKLGLSLSEYFGIPFAEPLAPIYAKVATDGSNLNLRSLPSVNSEILTCMPSKSEVTVFGIKDGWARLIYKETLGFAGKDYLKYI